MNTGFFKNKKGNFLAILVLMVVMLVFAITVVLSNYISNNFLTQFNNATNPTETQLEIQEGFTSSYIIYDYSVVFMVIGLIIGLMITSYLVPTHPVFLVINVIGIFVLIGFGMIMTNLYADLISADQGLSDVASNYSRMNFVIQYLPYFGAIAVFLASVVMYSRGNSMNFGSSGGGNY